MVQLLGVTPTFIYIDPIMDVNWLKNLLDNFSDVIDNAIILMPVCGRWETVWPNFNTSVHTYCILDFQTLAVHYSSSARNKWNCHEPYTIETGFRDGHFRYHLHKPKKFRKNNDSLRQQLV